MTFINTPSQNVITAIRCQDIQTGLQGYNIGDFDVLMRIGMASRLAIHIRGGDVLDYTHLKQVSHYLFDIPTIAFDNIITLLADIEFVRLVQIRANIQSIIPNVPYFDDLYEVLGEKAQVDGLNELEKASISILNKLSQSPTNKQALLNNLGLETDAFNRVLKIGDEGSYLQEVGLSTSEILLVSPLYFSENAKIFADAVSQYGEQAVKDTFTLLKSYPGVPYELVKEKYQLGDSVISSDQMHILNALVNYGITQPPAITTSYSGKTHFLFTPPVGTPKISIVEKEIYEKAMAVIASIRQGENFGEYRIRYPIAIIDALLDRGQLAATTIAKEQYASLALRKICKLVNTAGNYYQPKFIDIPENRKALELAREMLVSTDFIASRGLDEAARKTIFSLADYQESLRGYKDIQQKRLVKRTPEEHSRHIQKLLEMTQRGY